MSLRCAVPFHADPGQPAGPLPGQKIYLVTGREVRHPGAYVSWPSADAQYKKVSNATLKSYKSWEPLEAAWFAGCDRGEHDHPSAADHTLESMAGSFENLTLSSMLGASTTSSSPPAQAPLSDPRSAKSSRSPRPTPSTTCSARASPRPRTASSLPPAASALPAAPRPHSSKSRGSKRCKSPTGAAETTMAAPNSAPPLSPASAAIIGKMVYAVKHGSGGIVFDDYACARAFYHRLQSEGQRPSLATSASLTEGVSYVEGFSIDADAAARRGWIDEELEARGRHVVRDWEKAMDGWRRKRSGVWTSESDDGTSGESDLSDDASLSATS
ncbi:hypothetical protein B0H15DRAFT_943562 [Mycena belliarum]|uniref:Uncharacterized protein n=1 Tax=Mycena belliarum TaxID=1033014 RepID=A0AAD6UFV4_9AGAR|nr:hypothetical protein B0H15DRAFT_943562 [Mycena belliae]